MRSGSGFSLLLSLFWRALTMDQYRSRQKPSENFERHCSIRISGQIHMDQSLVHMNFLGKFVLTNGPESSSRVSPCTGIGPWMALPSNMPQAKTEVALQFSECCAAEVALQHWLFCSADDILTKSCAAASEKLQRNI